MFGSKSKHFGCLRRRWTCGVGLEPGWGGDLRDPHLPERRCWESDTLWNTYVGTFCLNTIGNTTTKVKPGRVVVGLSLEMVLNEGTTERERSLRWF